MSVERPGQGHLERTVATLEKEERSDGRGSRKSSNMLQMRETGAA